MYRKTVIVFDQGVAPALDMRQPFELSVRQSVLNPGRYPYVKLVGRNFGTVLDLSEPTKMNTEQLKVRDTHVENEVNHFLSELYLDPIKARQRLQELYQSAFTEGQKSRSVE